MGNLRSVAKALEAAGANAVVTSATSEVLRSEALCVPGQGIFGRCMDNLAAAGQDGLVRRWLEDGRPYLGICLGMQILFDSSEERGPVAGLSVLPGEVQRLRGDVRVPHMGWSEVNGEHFYFDHSFAVFPADDSFVTGWCTHGRRFAAMVNRGSLTAVQFHPEKSGAAGIALLRAWLTNAMSPAAPR
ncbi:MAG: imidazole glycerol phosphate synthase subunit HisH [Actinobacteria bacterium]|nr:imidazole glycerol phosphate synthase subunit HisH [Actinomycetota bacterium]